MQAMDMFGDFERIVFHGSSVPVEAPRVLTQGFSKDFGYGFYVTVLQKQAERWANKKSKGYGIVSVYEMGSISSKIKYKLFKEMNDDWLDFIIDCRYKKAHNYDLVEGPMADDVIYNYVESYVNGSITREEFWILAKFRYPTHQLCFCTDVALQLLKFRESYEVKNA